MSKIRILANDGIDAAGKELLEKAGFEVNDKHHSAEELPALLKAYDGITVRSATQVRKDLIDACPDLKLIGRAGVGMDNIDVAYAREKGISVYNTPAASSRSVAELVFSHAFSLARLLHASNRAMPVRGQSDFASLKKQSSAGFELFGKTIGIVGFGRIGQEVAKMALGLQMDVVAVDPFVSEVKLEFSIPGVEQPVHRVIKTETMDSLFSRADIITVHIPKADPPVIQSSDLGKLKKGVLLINTARGGVFNEDALLEGLSTGQIGGVGLDVFVGEPSPRKDLLEHPMISLSPHVGGSTGEAQKNIGVELAGYIIQHFS